MAQTQKAPHFTNLEAQLLKTQYRTTGTAPNFSVTIPNVQTLDELTGKEFKIINHVAVPFGANVTLSVNGLAAKNVSNFNAPNTTFRVTSLEGQVWSLIYNGTVFTLVDFGDTNPVTTANQGQVISGTKAFVNQIVAMNERGLGISSPNGFLYMRQASASLDTVGDTRVQFINSVAGFVAQICTVGNASKGGGTWVTVPLGKEASVNQLPYETLWTITPAVGITIGTRAVDLTPLFCDVVGAKSFKGADLFTYDKTSGVIKFNSPSNDYTSFSIVLRMNGLVFSSTSASSQYRIFLTRKDGVPTESLPSFDVAKNTGPDAKLTNTQLGPLLVRVIDKNDPFVTDGFRIWAIKDFGADLQFVAGKQQQLLLIR